MQRSRRVEPSREEYLEAAEPGEIVPVRAEASPSCGPVDLYRALPGDRKFLLESADMPGEDASRSRFSFVGGSPDAVATVTPGGLDVEALTENGEALRDRARDAEDPYDALRTCFPDAPSSDRFSRQAFTGGGVGYVAYDSVLPYIDRDLPDDAVLARFFLVSEVVVFDHAVGDAYVYETPVVTDPEETYGAAAERAEELADLVESLEPGQYGSGGAGDADPEARESFTREEFVEAVETAKRHILDGDIFQVVLSRRRTVDRTCSPYELYTELRDINPSPYMYLFEDGDTGVVGASPETLFGVTGDTLRVNPIAGTRRRGDGPLEDERLAREMLNDEKERAEHVMLVDLGRNDVRKVCRSGSVEVTDYMSVLRYSHVQHLESTVEGTLRPGMDAFDAARATFPAGTVSGAPKVRAMEIIDDLEPARRGVYAGGLGYVSWTGDADFAIVIRTAVFDGDEVRVQAGAGIVQDSDPEREYVETGEKMEAVIQALRRCSG